MHGLTLAAALAASLAGAGPGPLDEDLPFALGTAIAYSDACREAGFEVGDPQAALEALGRAAGQGAVRDALNAARISALRLADAEAVDSLLPAGLRRQARIDRAAGTCAALADSRFGSTLVRRPR